MDRYLKCIEYLEKKYDPSISMEEKLKSEDEYVEYCERCKERGKRLRQAFQSSSTKEDDGDCIESDDEDEEESGDEDEDYDDELRDFIVPDEESTAS